MKLEYPIPTFLKTVKSKNDNTVKYVLKTQSGSIVEALYINTNDGKDIICLPSQSMCEMECAFCHTTEHVGKIKTCNLCAYELTYLVSTVVEGEKLLENNRPLLVSFMGCGEPMMNIESIVLSMIEIKKELEDLGMPLVQFSISTSLPESASNNFFAICSSIKRNNLQVTMHLSLHYTDNDIRKKWMPKSMDIESSIAAMQFYKTFTKNEVEIHYVLINGVNDQMHNACALGSLLKNHDMLVKFLFYNKKTNFEHTASDKIAQELFYERLSYYRVRYEYYILPGLDIDPSRE